MNLLNQMSFVAGDCLPVLTGLPYRPIIQALSAHQEVGRGNPLGCINKSLLSVVFSFLSYSKIKSCVNAFFDSVLTVLFGNSHELPFLAVFPHPLNTVANVVESKSGGLNPHTRNAAMNTQATGEITPQIPLKQTSIADLLIHALQELSHIETLSCLDCDSSCILPSIFQHSQRGLNALHDLKNRLSIENLQA